MRNTNEMELIFDSLSANEGFARVAVAAFMTQLNPTVEEVADVKTAISEAVTNAVIHGYENEIHKIFIRCNIKEETIYIEVEDHGKGIEDVKKAMEPLFTTKPEMDRSGMGFSFMEAFMDHIGIGARRRNYGKNAKNNRKRKEIMDHTIALIRQSHDGDEKAREQLVEENIGLIWCIVKRFYGRGAEPEDLFQIGSIGLLKAIDKFDMTYDVKFSTYAVPMISGEIKRFLRDDGMIKVSRSLKELSYKAYFAKEKLQEKLGRDPTLEELAETMEVEKEELVMAMESSGEVESLHKPIYQKDGNEIQLMDKLEETGAQEEKVLNQMLLAQLLEGLEKEERQLIYLRYFANQTQSQVGKTLGISQVQVSRLEKKILKNLRQKV